MSTTSPLHVAVGVIKDHNGKILISLRHKSSHQGGMWEFPGGKVERNETVIEALKRELKEELGITAQVLTPLIKIKHQYPDLEVLLDVWDVTQFSGTPSGVEKQDIKWVLPDQLRNYTFPEANYPIITAAQLPSEYAILNGADVNILLDDLGALLNSGVKLVQARVKTLSNEDVSHFFKRAIPLCENREVSLLVNSAVKNINTINANGLHLTSIDLLSSKQKPTDYRWVSASCHNLEDLLHAEKIGLDFVVLAPVLTTTTHPTAKPLGWDRFKELTNRVNLPVYALGGIKKADLKTAKNHGAQGVAGISTFLSK